MENFPFKEQLYHYLMQSLIYKREFLIRIGHYSWHNF